MKIYAIRNPLNDRFARVHPAANLQDPRSCSLCGRILSIGPKPVIEWEPGSDVIGDFTWTILWDPIVTGQVRRFFEESRLTGVRFGEVDMVQSPRIKKPGKTTRRSQPRVYLPYEGPALFSTNIEHSAPIEEHSSTVVRTAHCSQCGLWGYDFIGVEHIEYGEWVPGTPIERKRVSRKPHHGVIVSQVHTGGLDFFRLGGPHCGVVCTERARLSILESCLTNIDLFEMGDVV